MARPGGLTFLGSPPSVEPIDTLIVKVAARCNMACTYCYWFRDLEVFERPPRMPEEVEAAFLSRLRSHLERHEIPKMTVVLHGGEPLLFGKHRFAVMCRDLRSIEADTNTPMSVCVTTNGILVDDEWAAVFRAFGVSVTVSIDGPAAVHDRHRPDLGGRPTHQRVIDGIAKLRGSASNPAC